MKLPTFTHFVLLLAVACSAEAQEIKPIQLPPPQKEIGKPLMQVLALRHSSRDFDTKPLPLQELSNLLWAGGGINRPESGKRTAPSAMNWQETDIYVILTEGAYITTRKPVSLHPCREGTSGAGGDTGIREGRTGQPRVRRGRSQDDKRERRRKETYGAADVGFIAENVYLYCASQDLAVVVRGSVDRTKLSEALKLRAEQKIILSQTVGYSK